MTLSLFEKTVVLSEKQDRTSKGMSTTSERDDDFLQPPANPHTPIGIAHTFFSFISFPTTACTYLNTDPWTTSNTITSPRTRSHAAAALGEAWLWVSH